MNEIEIWGHCWMCGHEKPHKRLGLSFYPRVVEMFAKKSDGKVDHRSWAIFDAAYQFAVCRKCGAPSMFVDEYWTKTGESTEGRTFRDLIQTSGKADGYETRTLRYPAFDAKPFPTWTHDLEETEMVLFWEVYSARSQGLTLLAMMGVRTLLDRFFNRTVGDVGGFAKKLELMRSEGHISNTQFAHLDVVINAGHAAAHRGVRFEKEHLDTSVEILESLLLEERFGVAIDTLRAVIPQRGKKPEISLPKPDSHQQGKK